MIMINQISVIDNYKHNQNYYKTNLKKLKIKISIFPKQQMKNKVIIKIYQKNLKSKLENSSYYQRISKWKLKVKINILQKCRKF